MSDQSQTSATDSDTPTNASLNGTSADQTSERVGTSGTQSSVIGRPLEAPSWATISGLVAAVAAGLAVVRYAWSWARPKPKTTDERLSEATHALGAAAVGLGGRAARRTAAVADRSAAAAEPVVKEAAARAADVAQDAAGLAVEGARKVAAVAVEGASEVADGVEVVQKAYNKFMRRLTIIVFGSLGYVLGAKAGRERYEQIVDAAQRVQGAAQSGS